MDVFGFFPPVDGVLDLMEFLIANIQGICGDLIPGKSPSILVSEAQIPGAREGMLQPISYFNKEITVTDGHGQSSEMSNVFAFVPDDISRNFAEISDYNNLLIALWQTAFHEVRHFVQFNLPMRDENFLTEDLIGEIAGLSASAGNVVKNRLCGYSHLNSACRKIEVDAIIVEALVVANFLGSFDGGTREFDYSKVKSILLMSKDQWNAEKLVLSRFT